MAAFPKRVNSSTLKNWAFVNILAEHNLTAYATSVRIFVALKGFEITDTVRAVIGF